MVVRIQPKLSVIPAIIKIKRLPITIVAVETHYVRIGTHICLICKFLSYKRWLIHEFGVHVQIVIKSVIISVFYFVRDNFPGRIPERKRRVKVVWINLVFHPFQLVSVIYGSCCHIVNCGRRSILIFKFFILYSWRYSTQLQYWT